MRRVKAVDIRWRRKTDLTRWRGWVDRGVGFTSWHFRTLHLTVEWMSPASHAHKDEDVTA